MLGGQDHEGGTEDGVGSGGKDFDGPLTPGWQRARSLAALGMRCSEVDLGTLRAAEPVPLRGGGAVGPVHLALVVEVGQQAVGVVGDPEEPLLQDALLD